MSTFDQDYQYMLVAQVLMHIIHLDQFTILEDLADITDWCISTSLELYSCQSPDCSILFNVLACIFMPPTRKCSEDLLVTLFEIIEESITSSNKHIHHLTSFFFDIFWPFDDSFTTHVFEVITNLYLDNFCGYEDEEQEEFYFEITQMTSTLIECYEADFLIDCFVQFKENSGMEAAFLITNLIDKLIAEDIYLEDNSVHSIIQLLSDIVPNANESLYFFKATCSLANHLIIFQHLHITEYEFIYDFIHEYIDDQYGEQFDIILPLVKNISKYLLVSEEQLNTIYESLIGLDQEIIISYIDKWRSILFYIFQHENDIDDTQDLVEFLLAFDLDEFPFKTIRNVLRLLFFIIKQNHSDDLQDFIQECIDADNILISISLLVPITICFDEYELSSEPDLCTLLNEKCEEFLQSVCEEEITQEDGIILQLQIILGFKLKCLLHLEGFSEIETSVFSCLEYIDNNPKCLELYNKNLYITEFNPLIFSLFLQSSMNESTNDYSIMVINVVTDLLPFLDSDILPNVLEYVTIILNTEPTKSCGNKYYTSLLSLLSNIALNFPSIFPLTEYIIFIQKLYALFRKMTVSRIFTIKPKN